MNEKRTYLGDGLYGWDEGFQFGLAASNGIEDTDSVFLDHYTLESFFRFIERSRNVKITITHLADEKEDASSASIPQ